MSPITYDPRAKLAPAELKPSGYLTQPRRPLSVVAEARIRMAEREPSRRAWLVELASRLGL